MEAIKNKLEHARQSLLDLTRRNRLINFKPGRRNSLRIVDEVPGEVYRILVTDQKNMEFLPLEKSEHYREADLADRDHEGEELTLFDLPDDDEGGGVADRHTDRYLQTALTGEKLQTQLIHLSREAESALQERGCGILFLVIGLLEWTERADSKVLSRAPVILVPVELVRETAKRRFKIRLFDDEPKLNPCLEQLCRQKFGFELPAFDEDAPDPINRLFTDIEERIAERDGWSLIPEMHVGLFSFAKILMSG